MGSAYCISAYEPDQRIGTWEDLADFRARLHARGMLLMVDFIPNHTGFDHPWVASHPDRYVQGDESAFRNNPGAFRAIETPSGDVRFVACGRDPYFAPWTDVAQLDYSNPDTRAAMIDVLEQLARHADGARCDMAMLVLSDVFSSTWRDYLRSPMPVPAREFWADARSAVQKFILLAEVYWDMEWRLQQLGFDFTYDKRLYDRLLHSPPADVRGHLTADADYQRRSARFIENHDEPRSAAEFGDRVASRRPSSSARFRDSAFSIRDSSKGERIICRSNSDDGGMSPQTRTSSASTRSSSPRPKTTSFMPASGGCSTSIPRETGRASDLLAWQWVRDGELRIVVVNLGGETAQGLVQLSSELPGDPRDDDDPVRRSAGRTPVSVVAKRAESQGGLYVKLEKGAAHILRIV